MHNHCHNCDLGGEETDVMPVTRRSVVLLWQ